MAWVAGFGAAARALRGDERRGRGEQQRRDVHGAARGGEVQRRGAGGVLGLHGSAVRDLPTPKAFATLQSALLLSDWQPQAR